MLMGEGGGTHNIIFIKLNSPICKAFSTAPCSRSLTPCWNGNLSSSSSSVGAVDKEEYIQMSLSFRGKDQYTIRLWTGSGILTNLSSIVWNVMFSATILAPISSRESGLCVFLCFPSFSWHFEEFWAQNWPWNPQHNLFGAAIGPHLTIWPPTLIRSRMREAQPLINKTVEVAHPGSDKIYNFIHKLTACR